MHLHDVMSINLKVKEINEDETFTEIELLEPVLTPNYNYFLSPISHIVDEDNYRYDTSSFLKKIVSGEEVGVTQENIYKVMTTLIENGVPVKIINFK